MMHTAEPQLGRFLVTSIHLNMRAPRRKLDFTIAFRGDDFRAREAALRRVIDAELQRADTPFEPADSPSTNKGEEIFRDANEPAGMDGAYYKVTMHVKDAFAPFGPGGGAAIGLGPVRPEGGSAPSETPPIETAKPTKTDGPTK